MYVALPALIGFGGLYLVGYSIYERRSLCEPALFIYMSIGLTGSGFSAIALLNLLPC